MPSRRCGSHVYLADASVEMSNQRKDKSSLAPYRELIEQLVVNNPEITNKQILESLPIKVDKTTVSKYRHKLGLPCNDREVITKKLRNRPKKPSILAPYREIIEQLVSENPTIANHKIAQQLPVKVSINAIFRYRKKLGLPSKVAPPQKVVPRYRKQIEQWVRENPNVSNQTIAQRLPFEVGHTAVNKYRKMWGLPNGNRKGINGKSALEPFREQIINLVNENPGITNAEIATQVPVDVSVSLIKMYRAKLGLPSSLGHPKHILIPYREIIESLVKNNPQISNSEVLKQLPVKVNLSTIGAYRHLLGLPVNTVPNPEIERHREQIEQFVRENPSAPDREVVEQLSLTGITINTLGYYRRKWGLPFNSLPRPDIERHRDQIEQFVSENPKATNQEVIERLSLTGITTNTLRRYRHRWGLPVNSNPKPDMEQHREQIEQLVRKNPKITNVEIVEQLSLAEITEMLVGKYRLLWGLPCNTPIASNLQEYRATIEQLIHNNPAISNREIIERLPIDSNPNNLYYFRRKWNLPRNTIVVRPGCILDECHEQIKQLIDDDPNITDREIRKRLSVKVCLTTIYEYRKKNGWLRSQIRRSQITQRIPAIPNSNAVDDPIENTESPAPETPPQIPLETLVRNFWADKARAVDVLLLPPDLRLKITESVEEALAYAWNSLGKR